MTASRKDRIRALLKGIETGDPASVAVISPDVYIQHNPQTHTGREGLAALFARLSRTSPRVNIPRIFSDGDFVFAHTEYDFSTRRVGFEVFRFDGDLAVEHWDNIQPRRGPNPSDHSMVDGAVEVTDLERTEANREAVRLFVDRVLIQRRARELARHIDGAAYVEHNPRIGDGLAPLAAALAASPGDAGVAVRYEKRHRLLAEGNFVLSVCEGSLDSVHTAFYDLFRLASGKIVEHWDTTEPIPPPSEWKHQNGKF